MTAVQAAYLQHHLGERRSRRDAEHAFRTMNEFMSARSRYRVNYRVAEFDLLQQRAYARAEAERGLSPKSIATALSFIAAAVNWAARDQIVKDAGQERQVRILSQPITVEAGVSKIAAIVDAEIDEAPRWLPQRGQLAAFIDAVEDEMVFRFVVVALNTWARREAVTDLRMSAVNFNLGLVNLNPPGRKQTRKRRPILPLTDNLRGWMLHWNDEWPVRWYREDRSDLWDGFRAVAARVGMASLTPHALRHFMNSRALALGVPAEERSRWLGHMDKRASPTTEIYEHATPDYLGKAREATDAIVTELDALAQRSLKAPGQPVSIRRMP